MLSLAMITAMPDGKANWASKDALGALNFHSMAWLPLASRLTVSLATDLPRGAISIQRLSEATTSCASRSRPLCNFTPLRMLIA